MEPPLCVVSSWLIRVYTILVWRTISGSSNLDICCYHCLILTLILQLKVLINFFFFFFIIIITIITIIVVVIVLLLTIIYTINLPVVRPRSCRVIYYFDTPALGRRHQSFGRVSEKQKWWAHSYSHLEWMENVCWLQKAKSCYTQRSFPITIHGSNAWTPSR